MAAQLLVLCRSHQGQKAQSYNICHPHPVCLQKQVVQPETEPKDDDINPSVSGWCKHFTQNPVCIQLEMSEWLKLQLWKSFKIYDCPETGARPRLGCGAVRRQGRVWFSLHRDNASHLRQTCFSPRQQRLRPSCTAGATVHRVKLCADSRL